MAYPTTARLLVFFSITEYGSIVAVLPLVNTGSLGGLSEIPCLDKSLTLYFKDELSPFGSVGVFFGDSEKISTKAKIANAKKMSFI